MRRMVGQTPQESVPTVGWQRVFCPLLARSVLNHPLELFCQEAVFQAEDAKGGLPFCMKFRERASESMRKL